MECHYSALVSKRLKAITSEKGLTQTQLAQNAGLTMQTVNSYLNGRKSIFSHSLQLICEQLGVTPTDILVEPPSTDQKTLEMATLTAQKTIELLLDQGRLKTARKK